VSSVSIIFNIFNSQHPRLQFTMEVGDDRLNFLDVTVIRDNELIEFNCIISRLFWVDIW